MSKSAVGRVPQQDQQLDIWVVVPNPLDRRLPINVTGRDFPHDLRSRGWPEMFVQQLKIDWLLRKNFLVIEEVKLLFVRQRNLWVLAQEIMQRGRSRFLRAGNNEIESFNLS